MFILFYKKNKVCNTNGTNIWSPGSKYKLNAREDPGDKSPVTLPTNSKLFSIVVPKQCNT